MKIDSAKKLAALGVAAGFLLVSPFSGVPASAESNLNVRQNGASKQGVEGYIRENTLEANDETVQAAAEERGLTRAKRQSSTGLAHPRASSGLLSGSGFKPLAAAALIGALSSVLFRGGSASEGPREDGELRSGVAPAAGLSSSLISNKMLVGLLGLLLVSSSLALHTHNMPHVETVTDENGDKVVVIGKEWTDFTGYPKDGDKVFPLEFKGQKYRLHTSYPTENNLILLARGTDGLRRMLASKPVHSEEHGGLCWQCDKPDTEPFYVDTFGNPPYAFYLDEKSAFALGGVYTEGGTDMKRLLQAFVREVRKRDVAPTTTAPTTPPAAHLEAEAGGPPVTTLAGARGRTIFIVGQNWGDKTGHYRVPYSINRRASLQLLLTKGIENSVGTGLMGYLVEAMTEGFDLVKETKGPVDLLGELPKDITVSMRHDHPEAYRELQQLLNTAQKVILANVRAQ